MAATSDQIIENEPKSFEEDIRLQQFCEHYCFGVPVTEALRYAGYEIQTAAFGFSLLCDPRARDIIDVNRKWLLSKVKDNIQHVIEQCDRDREEAWKAGNMAVAHAATMNKAKLLGYMDPTRDIGGKKYVFAWAAEVPEA